MNRQRVISSNIKTVGHDPHTNTLEIEFNDGRVFQYAGVDQAKHQALMAAPSTGKHFHKFIKGKHPMTPA